MPDGEPAGHHVRRPVVRVGESERVQDEVPHCCFEGRADDVLENAPGQHHCRVVVGHDRPGRRQLWQLVQAGDKAGECIVAIARVLELLAVPASGVVHQLKNGHGGGSVCVRQLGVRQVPTNRRGHVDLAALLEKHQRGCGHCLARRAELKQGAAVHGQGVAETGHPDVGLFSDVAMQHSCGDTDHP